MAQVAGVRKATFHDWDHRFGKAVVAQTSVVLACAGAAAERRARDDVLACRPCRRPARDRGAALEQVAGSARLPAIRQIRAEGSSWVNHTITQSLGRLAASHLRARGNHLHHHEACRCAHGMNCKSFSSTTSGAAAAVEDAAGFFLSTNTLIFLQKEPASSTKSGHG